MEAKTPGYDKRWMALLFIGISLLVISLDNTILNVALPSISRELNASSSQLQWIVDAYVLIFAAMLLTMGSVGDRVGRKRALQIGLVLFGMGSLGSALSTTTDALIVTRAFTGLAGATIMPATLSIISATFPREERSQAIAIWAAIFGLGVGLGPVIGGWLLKHYEWESVFFINLPVVVIGLTGGAFYIADSKDPAAPSPDIPGVILSITGLFALVYGIIEAGQKSWTETNVLIAFAIAGVLLGLFAIWESRAPNAMLPMYFFKNMSFTGANTALAMVTFSLFGSMFFISQYFQSVLGYTALESGLRMLPMALILMVTAASSARIAARLGTKITVALGILTAGGGLFFFSQVLSMDTTYSSILLGFVIFAVGMGMTMSPATNSIMQSVPVNKAGIGSAMNDTTRQLGGALGVAVLGTIMNSIYLDKVEILQGTFAQMPDQTRAKAAYEAVSSSIQGAHIVAASMSQNPALAEISKTIVDTANRAFVDGMTEAMFIGSLIMLGASLLTLIILPAQVITPEEASEISSEAGVNLQTAVSATD